MPLNNEVIPYQHSSCPVKPEFKQRLFIAISYRPTPKVVKLLEHLQKLAVDPATRLRVVAVPNLHITLKFLGMVPETHIASVHQVLDQQLSRHPPFEIKLIGLGCFRKSLWLGIEPSDPLEDLAMRLDKDLTTIGFSAEPRVFVPHLTVARIGRDGEIKIADLQQQYGKTQWGLLTAAEVHLYQSKTLSTGAEYSIIHSSRFDI